MEERLQEVAAGRVGDAPQVGVADLAAQVAAALETALARAGGPAAGAPAGLAHVVKGLDAINANQARLGDAIQSAQTQSRAALREATDRLEQRLAAAFARATPDLPRLRAQVERIESGLAVLTRDLARRETAAQISADRAVEALERLSSFGGADRGRPAWPDAAIADLNAQLRMIDARLTALSHLPAADPGADLTEIRALLAEVLARNELNGRAAQTSVGQRA
jgi:hypothetical protein